MTQNIVARSRIRGQKNDRSSGPQTTADGTPDDTSAPTLRDKLADLYHFLGVPLLVQRDVEQRADALQKWSASADV